MPFDPTPIERPVVSRNGVEVGKLRMLSEALKKEMPERFQWDYSTVSVTRNCGTAGCAIGLAYALRLIQRSFNSEWDYFGLSSDEGVRVFNNSETYGKERHREVTPAMVAAELDKVIAREEAA